MVWYGIAAPKSTLELPKIQVLPASHRRNYSSTLEIILNKRDGRQKVDDPHIFPWCINGHLNIIYEHPKNHPWYLKVYVGSAVLVNFRHALTAGHCLYSLDEGIPDAVIFYPGRNGNVFRWSSPAQHVIIHPSYHQNADTDSDLGMIVLENKKIGHETGWARLRIFEDDQLLEGLNVNITGYPYDKFDRDGNPYMYTMSGAVKVATRNRFYYHVDTSGGQSGSSVTVPDGISGNIDCLGIHTTGSNVEGNGATRITQEKFNKIGKWVTASFDHSNS